MCETKWSNYDANTAAQEGWQLIKKFWGWAITTAGEPDEIGPYDKVLRQARAGSPLAQKAMHIMRQPFVISLDTLPSLNWEEAEGLLGRETSQGKVLGVTRGKRACGNAIYLILSLPGCSTKQFHCNR